MDFFQQAGFLVLLQFYVGLPLAFLLAIASWKKSTHSAFKIMANAMIIGLWALAFFSGLIQYQSGQVYKAAAIAFVLPVLFTVLDWRVLYRN